MSTPVLHRIDPSLDTPLSSELEQRFHRLCASWRRCTECAQTDLRRPDARELAIDSVVDGVCGVCGAFFALDPDLSVRHLRTGSQVPGDVWLG
jgi:hypothetical protein